MIGNFTCGVAKGWGLCGHDDPTKRLTCHTYDAQAHKKIGPTHSTSAILTDGSYIRRHMDNCSGYARFV